MTTKQQTYSVTIRLPRHLWLRLQDIVYYRKRNDMPGANITAWVEEQVRDALENKGIEAPGPDTSQPV